MTTRSVPRGSSASACHTMAGSRPEIRRSARAMSRSRLMPGKTRTADFIKISERPSSSGDLDAVVLDHGVGQKLFGRCLERRLGAGAIGAFDLDIEYLALADAGDPAHTERSQRAFNGLALRIEDAGFQRDGDAGFHVENSTLASSISIHRSRRNGRPWRVIRTPPGLIGLDASSPAACANATAGTKTRAQSASATMSFFM